MRNKFAFPFLTAFAFLFLNQAQAISGDGISGGAVPQKLAGVSRIEPRIISVINHEPGITSLASADTHSATQTGSVAPNLRVPSTANVVIQGVNTAGSVRREGSFSFNVETTLNIAANLFAVLGVLSGLFFLDKTIKQASAAKRALYALSGMCLIVVSISLPIAEIYLVNSTCGSRGDIFQ